MLSTEVSYCTNTTSAAANSASARATSASEMVSRSGATTTMLFCAVCPSTSISAVEVTAPGTTSTYFVLMPSFL